MIQITAAVSPHGLLQVVLDHVHQLTPLSVMFFGAELTLKDLAGAVVKWLLVLLLPQRLLARFAPSWLPTPSLPAKMKPAKMTSHR